jgi:hypothetical protein
MDYFLRANTESILWDKLVEVGAAVEIQVKDQNGNVIETRHQANTGFVIDVIGTIYKPTGNMIQQTLDDAVIEVPELSPIPGFHANLRGPANLSSKVEYIQYQLTDEDRANSEFVMPTPEEKITPSPLEELLVKPKNPVRVWL